MNEDVTRQFDLLKQLVRPADGTEFLTDLSSLEKLIAKELPEALEQEAPPNFPEIYFDFQQEFQRFKEFMLYSDLIGKSIVALGGGFSSGKSTFLNTLLGEELLPADIDPSTSVPTYLVHGDELSAYGINVFSAKVQLQPSEIDQLAHGFGKAGGKEVTLGHLLSSLFLAAPAQTFSHLALLDTPGYSKADTADYSAKTDEKIARTQLNSANYILWFVQADAGTITDADISFLKSLKPEIPKVVIVNKADKLMDDELEEVMERIRETLLLKGIEVENVYAYSSDEPEDYDQDEILACLKKWDTQTPVSRFAYNFKRLFSKCGDFYDERLEEEKKRHSRMSAILCNDLDADARQELQLFDNATVRQITRLKESKQKLKQMQTDFFSEIKQISDLVHIEMPEPTEIDLLQDRRTDIGDVLKEYGKKAGLDTPQHRNLRNQFESLLADALSDVSAQQCALEGSTGHLQENAKLLEDLLQGCGPNRVNDKLLGYCEASAQPSASQSNTSQQGQYKKLLEELRQILTEGYVHG